MFLVYVHIHAEYEHIARERVNNEVEPNYGLLPNPAPGYECWFIQCSYGMYVFVLAYLHIV